MPAASGVLVDNVDFIGWGKENSWGKKSTGITGTQIICNFGQQGGGGGGWEWQFQNIRWFDTEKRVRARWINDVNLIDLDGSFGGTAML